MKQGPFLAGQQLGGVRCVDSFSVDPIEVKDQMIGHDPGSGKPFGVI